jgi:hypothetical protein
MPSLQIASGTAASDTEEQPRPKFDRPLCYYGRHSREEHMLERHEAWMRMGFEVNHISASIPL